MKRILTFLLAALLCAGLLPWAAYAADDLPFIDVSPEAWYYGDVKTAREAGLINGKTDTTYCPDDLLTYAEAVKLAACMYQKNETGTVSLVNGDPWYQSYVDYAKMKGIIAKDYDWTAPATRAGYMAIFAHALPDASLAAKNEVPDGSIPDVPANYPEAPEIYKLYRAGILQGSDDNYNGAWTKHLCKPADNIKRSEVAAILTRMMFVDKRISFSMAAETPPKTETPKTDPLKIVKSPQSAALKAVDDKVSFTVEITGGKAPYNYKWWIEKETGSNFQQVDSEKKTSTYNVTFSKDSFTFTKYIRVYVEVTDAEGTKVTSEKAEVKPFTEAADLKITKQPQIVTIDAPKDVELDIAVSGGKKPYIFQWQRFTGGAWKDIELSVKSYAIDKENSSVFTAAIDSSKDWMVNEAIRCVVSDSSGQKVTSDQVLIILKQTAEPLRAVKQPVDYVMTSPTDNPKFTFEFAGGTPPYQVDVFIIYENESNDVMTWENFDSTKMMVTVGSEDNFAYLNAGHKIQVMFVVEDSAGSDILYSDRATAYPYAAPTEPLKITKQPNDATCAIGDTATFFVEAEGGKKPYSYQWCYIYNSQTRIFNKEIGQSAVLTFKVDDAMFYSIDIFCEVTDANGEKKRTDSVCIYNAAGSMNQLKIVTQPKDYWMRYTQEDVTFTITVDGGCAPYTYEWYYGRKGSYIQFDSTFTTNDTNSATFTFSPADFEDLQADNLDVFCIVTDDWNDSVTSKICTVYMY